MQKLAKAKPVLLAILIIILIAATFVASQESIKDIGGLAFAHEFTQNENPQAQYAYISGEVVNPGTYKFNDELRIGELVEKAGGFTSNADLDYVNKELNLSSKVSDEAKIYIPSKNNNTTSQTSDNSKININTASEAELDSLPGIGPSTAKKIIDARPFKSIDDLKNVSGIGDSKFNEISNLISV